jgi:hypothetical protein
MRKPLVRFLTAALVAATGMTALLAPPAAAASRQAATGHPATVSHLAGNASSASSAAVLLNGDQIVPAGSRGYAVIPAGTGLSAETMSITLGGRSYEIPDAAFPYLGHGLDPSLFDAAKLPRTGRLPVTITYSGTSAPALPGVTITSTRVGTASGYLTAVSARRFGTALVRQFAVDHTTGAYGTDGMFANGTTIRLAGVPAAAPPPGPRFPMHTLTMNGITLKGTPDTGDTVGVLNTDNLGHFGDIYSFDQSFYHGAAKFSVPAGHYLAIGMYGAVNRFGQPTGPQHIVINPGFTVAGNTSVTLDERTATSKVTVSTPRPADQGALEWTLRLVDATGSNSFGEELIDYGTKTPLYLNGTARHPLSGSFRVLVNAHMVSPATSRSLYTYDVSFAGATDVIASHYTATAANLATVAAKYYSDEPQSGYLSRYPQYSFTLSDPFFVPVIQITAPLARTEYMTAGKPTIYWVVGQYMASRVTGGGGDYDADRSYSPGQNITENWNQYPLHPTLATSILGNQDIAPTYLSATRTSDSLMFNIIPFGDNTPGHSGEGYYPGDLVPPPGGISGRYELDQNGVKIAAGNADRPGFAGFSGQFNVTAAPATYRLTLTADRASGPYLLSTRTSTVWTWRSAHESGHVVPSGWACQNNTRDCTSQPLLTLGYDVAGMGTDGVAPAGAQVVKVSVGHQQLSAGSATKTVTAQFSVDGGASWQPATVKRSGGTWYASFSAPAAAKVTLMVSATDSNGGAISETIYDAYATSTSAASAGYRSANCAQLTTGHVSCYLVYSTQTAAARAAAAGFATSLSAPVGWGATAIQQAYKLPVTRPGGTVAVVEMFDTPRLESYLNTYRKQYGLPPCTTANGCFRKVNEYGQATPLPPDGTHTNWDMEATLDVDMISAACPKCHILVVEAKPVSWADFAAAEDTAARLGAVAISNSYGTRETGQVQTYAGAYHHPGHTIVAASGDSGFIAANFPAALSTVTAVGGTQLNSAPNGRGYSEIVWNNSFGASGSGCSAYVAKPAWQHDTHCPGRTVADMSSVAIDIAVYEPTYGGWVTVGGTSAASPLIAGIYALAGNAGTVKPGYEYAHPRAFFDVTTGNNDWADETGGAACGDDYLCVAKPGYDAPTGLGTPNGITGF